MNEKIGIIIPSYNQGKYLERTILSVLGNSQNANIQIALIDGGSTDNTWNIIQKYKNYITAWCSEPDNGQAAAINKGIRLLPECQYYMWLNSDDVFETDDSVKKILDFAVANKYEVCYGLSHFIDEDGNIIGDYPVDLNDMSVLEENIEQQQEELEIMVEQNNVAEDDIFEIKIVIDSLWCPFELGINNDMRN